MTELRAAGPQQLASSWGSAAAVAVLMAAMAAECEARAGACGLRSEVGLSASEESNSSLYGYVKVMGLVSGFFLVG
jgi:hypothetical protein